MPKYTDPSEIIPAEYLTQMYENLRLQEKRDNPTAEDKNALTAELDPKSPSAINLYQVAANMGQGRDPSKMGEIERLLYTGDTAGLESRIGHGPTQQLLAQFDAARTQFEKDRDAERSLGRATTDTALGVVGGVANAAMGLAMFGTGVVDKDAAAKVGDAYNWVNKEVIDVGSSDALLAHKRVKDARDTGAEQQHTAQMEADVDPTTRGDLVPSLTAWGKRIVQDAASGAYNTATDPTLLVGGTADMAASMLMAAGTGKVLAMTGQGVAKQVATQVAKTALTRELTGVMGAEAAQMTAASLAKTLGAKMVEGELAQAGLAKLGFFGSNAILEGSSQYAQVSSQIRRMKTEELLKAPGYQSIVDELKKQNPATPEEQILEQAKNRFAHDVASGAAVETGLVAGSISTLMGGQGINPTKLLKRPETARGIFGELFKEQITEAAEESAQGFTGQLISNRHMIEQATPSLDPAAGVGLQTGDSAVLAFASTGMLKGRDALRGGTVAAGEGISTVANLARERGAKIEAARAAESNASLQNLVRRTDELQTSGTALRQDLIDATQSVVNSKGEEAAIAPVNAFNALVESLYVTEAPKSFETLSPAQQAELKFNESESRATLADKTAKMLVAEENPSAKAKLARALGDLLEPTRTFQEESDALAAYNESPVLRKQIQGYREVLSGIENLPSVKEALSQSQETLTSALAASSQAPVTKNTLAQPETMERAKNLAAMAVADPGALVEHSSPDEIKLLLKHGEDVGVSPSQAKALEGSLLALLAPAQAMQDKRLTRVAELAAPSLKGTNFLDDIKQRHLLSQKLEGGERVTGEITVERNSLESGKYSARQHIDRVIRSMAAGNAGVARTALQHFANLVEHMDNKVMALEESRENKGVDVSYKQLMPDGKTWKDSSTNPKSEYKHAFLKIMSASSIAHAQAVDTESHLLHEILRGLIKAYPELGVQAPVSESRITAAIRTADPTQMATKNVADWKAAEERKAQKQKPKQATTPVPVVKAKTGPEKAAEMLNKAVQRDVIETKPQSGKAPGSETKLEPKPELKKPVEESKVTSKVESKPESNPTPKILHESVLRDARKSLNKAQRKAFLTLDSKAQIKALAIDTLSGLLSRTGAEYTPADPKRPFMAIFSLEGKKFLNDFHDHPAMDGVFRLMARVLKENGIKDGMKIGGDVQAFFGSLAEAQAIAAKMQAVLGQDFRVGVNGTERVGSLANTLEAAYEVLDAENKTARDAGKLAHRMAPPVSLQGPDMPKGINWDWDEKAGKTTGLNPKGDQVKSWLKSVAAKVKTQADQFKAEPSEQYAEVSKPASISILKLSDQEKLDIAYRNPVTGLLSQAGFDLASEGATHFASLDLRSLKAMNVKFGQGEADHILKIFADTFVAMGGDFFAAAHLHGDEFAMATREPEKMKVFIEIFEAALKNVTLYKAKEDGTVVTQKGISFAWGIDKSPGLADTNLNTRKEVNREPISEPVETKDDAARAKQQLAEAKATPGAVDLGPFSKRPGERRQAVPGNAVGDGQARPEARGPDSQQTPGAIQKVVPVAPKTTAEAYPNLYPGLFIKGLQIKTLKDGRPLSRLLGKTNSVKVVQDALQTEQSLKDFTGSEALKGNATDPVRVEYFKLLNAVPEIVANLQTNLDSFLASTWKDGKTVEQFLSAKSGQINERTRTKALNVLELGPDGKFRYNPELASQAAMAAIQWVISASQRQTGITKDESDIASDLGLKLEDGMSMDEDLKKALSEGESLSQAKRSLAGAIRRFWGVEANKKVGMGYSEAVPEAVAAEMFRALVDAGMLEVKTIDLSKIYPELTDKTPQRYVPINLNEGESAAIYEYPELLEEVVVTEPERAVFYGDTKVPRIDHQMSNPNMPTTPESDKAREAMQDQKFFLNLPMVNAIYRMKPEEIINLFGHPLPKDPKQREALYNKTHLETLEGKNKTLLAGFFELQNTVKQMTNLAEGGDVGKIAKKYQYAVSSVNRIMMLGANNPQSHKLMREMLMSTWSEALDLTGELKSDHYRAMMLAVAQALDTKPHKKSFDENANWAHNEINGRLAPVISSLVQWLDAVDAAKAKGEKTPASPLGEIKKVLGEKSSPLAAMALMEVARMKRAKPEELKAFRTPLYFEADGMTNGPFNAMGLLTTGAFTSTWVENVGRGGLSFGEESKTADQLFKALDKKDNYQAAAEATRAKTLKHLTQIEKQEIGGKPVADLAKQLFGAMSVLMGDEVQWENNELTLDRSFVKNPMTVSIYGSGKKGIANKVTYKFTKAFYETMTALAQSDVKGTTAEKLAAILFPEDANGVKKANDFLKAVNALTSKSVGFSLKNGYFLKSPEGSVAMSRLDRPQAFKFSGPELANLQNNLMHLAVEPMHQGIRETLGESVFRAGELLVQATKLHSVLAREMFYKAIQDKIAAKTAALEKSGVSSKDAREKVSSEFLSRDEVNKIWSDLLTIMPILKSDGQSFLLAKTNLLRFVAGEGDKKRTLYEYSRAFDDSGRTPPDVTAVDDAGVSAIPYLTIGMGDGRMVRSLFEAGLPNALQVYDGINIPVDRITEYGSKINESALRAFQGNVFQALSESFNRAMNDERVTKALLNDGTLIAKLGEALQEPGDESAPDSLTIRSMIETMQDSLKFSAMDVEARMAALKKVSISMDQMAGTYQPFFRKGEIQIDKNASAQDIAVLLEGERLKELARLEGRSAEMVPVAEATTAAPTDLFVGERHESGVMILSGKTAIRGLVSGLKSRLNPSERSVLSKAVSSGSLDGVRVIAGNAEQILAYQKTNGLSSFTDLNAGNMGRTIHGYYSSAEKTVYLMNPQLETVVHELIHASTFNTLLAHYAGKSVGPEVATAVKHLEGLMGVFLNDDKLAFTDSKTGDALRNARKEITSYGTTTAQDKAARLNEFMSWVLANRQLASDFGGMTYSRLGKILTAAWKAIKTFLWGGTDEGPAANSKVLTQIKFNTAILSRAAPTVEAMLADSQVKHATLAMREAPNRLDHLNQAFNRMIARNLNRTYDAKWLISKGSRDEATLKTPRLVADATARAAVAAFPDMSAQARATFQRMVMAFATDAQINPQAMSKAQEIYEGFMQGMAVEDFMTGQGDVQTDESLARRKFEFLVGHDTKGLKDDQRRSTILPAFLALAAVDDSFRKLLASKSLKNANRQAVVGLDSAIENLGLEAQERTGNTLAGVEQNPVNIQTALDQLTDGIVSNVLNEKTSLTSKLEGSENNLARMANDRMVDALKRVGASSLRAGEKLAQSNSKLAQALSVSLKAISFMADEKDATAVSEGAQDWMDKRPDASAFARELVNDLLGRLPSQAQIYDMLKRVRTHVTQARQNYREKVPMVIESKFKHAPNAAQWDALHRFMGKYDMAAMLDRWSVGEALELASNAGALQSEISRLESVLRGRNPAYLSKINQFAKFVQTGVRGSNLLTNAWAIADLLGEKRPVVAADEQTIQDIDQLITLKLLAQADERDRRAFVELYAREREGLEFTLNYLKGQRKDELAKALDGMAKYNHVKGSIASSNREGHVTVAPDTKHADMVSLGYTRVGAYQGSNIDAGGVSKSYYYSPDGGAKTTFTQGIAQNVQATAYGVHAMTGVELGPNAGVITDPVTVERLAKQMAKEVEGPENLSPIYNQDGNLVAFVRTLSAEQMAVVKQPQHLAQAIGQWRGRQVEEIWADDVNSELVDHLYEAYEKDPEKDRYENVFESKDPIIRDAVALFPKAMREAIQAKFGDGAFYIRRGLVNTAIGYRQASIGDSWTGVSRMSEGTQEQIRQTMTGLVDYFLGKNAYQTLIWAEKNWQAAMASVRTNIVVRSIVVPAANFVSGIYQLRGRGVPLVTIAKGVPAKIQEIETYTKSRTRKVELEAAIRASAKVNETLKLEAELQALLDSQRRLSIWPLIEAGEFSTISDVGETAEDLETGNSTFIDKITAAVDKLPPGLRDAARQGYMARDTAVFKAMQKATQYSDFIMKAVYYDHLIKNETGLLEETAGYDDKVKEIFTKSKEAHIRDARNPLLSMPQAKRIAREAMARGRVTEEFVNYDMPTGRTRGYLENMGLVWFQNYKLRSAKIALSMIRNNPFQSLMSLAMPHIPGSDTPISGNLFAKLFQGVLGYSVGPRMALQPIALNPWYNLIAE